MEEGKFWPEVSFVDIELYRLITIQVAEQEPSYQFQVFPVRAFVK
jgi:hypothetical protein